MKLELKFKENSQKLDMSFGQFQDVTDGGFERGRSTTRKRKNLIIYHDTDNRNVFGIFL